MELDDEWLNFLGNPSIKESVITSTEGPIPSPTDLYVSTNTIISYLNEPIDLHSTFWGIPIIPYNCPQEGVIKKQMKFNSTTQEEVLEIQKKLVPYEYSIEHIISHVEDKGSLKYKDTRKITVGISRRDILSYRIRHKGAFYNCFALVIRLHIDSVFREYHLKVFNTGKLEIPGIQRREHIPLIIDYLLSILKPYYPRIVYNSFMEETVLVNSNFNCGFHIKRNKMFDLLKYKYNISAVYDPCSYPGIQCKVYYNNGVTTTIQSIAVSFMIFRTGSILIVGKCSIQVIHEIYDYLVKLLETEYLDIVESHTPIVKKEMISRKNKRFILIS
jgi:TATA-box binding protein (TBP) (component of TFIID and TFIIIB)